MGAVGSWAGVVVCRRLMFLPPSTEARWFSDGRFQVDYPRWVIEHPGFLSHVQAEAPC